jgi:hypothetical protein
MAKRRKAPPARSPRGAQMEEHSLLLRSAESLGRVIGALQRQLDDASRRLSPARRESSKSASRVRAEAANGKSSRKAGKKKAATRKPATKRKRTTH